MIERIYIPTVRRTDNQITFDNLPDELKKRVIMVIESGERHLYEYDCEYLEIPEEIVGTWTQLAQTRKFIHKHAGAIKYLVADDDIRVWRRNSKNWSEISNMEKSKRPATSDEIVEMFETVDTWLDEKDIGLVGLSPVGVIPSSKLYEDTKGVYSYIFYDGRMLSKVIDDMDITSLRIAEDSLFLFEALVRGINSRRSTEWLFDNRSDTDRSMQDSRVVWTGMYEDGRLPEKPYQSDEHNDAMRFLQKKYPRAVTVKMIDGTTKTRKYFSRAYIPAGTHSLSDFMDEGEE